MIVCLCSQFIILCSCISVFCYHPSYYSIPPPPLPPQFNPPLISIIFNEPLNNSLKKTSTYDLFKLFIMEIRNVCMYILCGHFVSWIPKASWTNDQFRISSSVCSEINILVLCCGAVNLRKHLSCPKLISPHFHLLDC